MFAERLERSMPVMMTESARASGDIVTPLLGVLGVLRWK